ncbi:MAG: hypothetical protein Q9P01_07230 [Anaerolineae bacterium]|nr:hypothetical protein [Anaerolineae bacterium]MDQ7034618.1 hypothetical protein [Anaerolineae bacterium]
MAKKLKGRANPLSELHFITDISLEQSVMLVGDCADDSHTVTLIEIDSDSFKFEVISSRQKSRQAKIYGKLHRWQGTETAVCTYDTTPHQEQIKPAAYLGDALTDSDKAASTSDR